MHSLERTNVDQEVAILKNALLITLLVGSVMIEQRRRQTRKLE